MFYELAVLANRSSSCWPIGKDGFFAFRSGECTEGRKVRFDDFWYQLLTSHPNLKLRQKKKPGRSPSGKTTINIKLSLLSIHASRIPYRVWCRLLYNSRGRSCMCVSWVPEGNIQVTYIPPSAPGVSPVKNSQLGNVFLSRIFLAYFPTAASQLLTSSGDALINSRCFLTSLR